LPSPDEEALRDSWIIPPLCVPRPALRPRVVSADASVAIKKSQAKYDEAILRALKHFSGQMSPELRQHVDTRLNDLRTKFGLTTGVQPLRCPYGFGNAQKSTAPLRPRTVPQADDERPPAAEPPIVRDPDLEVATLRRTADLVFPSAQVAVFLDGCFWHGCPKHHTVAVTNAKFWSDKVEANRARDRDTDQRLVDAGWVSIRVWEHEDPLRAALRVKQVVAERKSR
jgi:DNA mismatch endonuclease (patch repair protein)